MAAAEALLTAEEFGRRPDPGYPEERLQGRIVPTPLPRPRHGRICKMVTRLLDRHVEERDLGQILSNDSGVITERDPDIEGGVTVAIVMDTEPRTAHVSHADLTPQQLGPDDELTVPDVFGDFRVRVGRFFE
jgi:hypothetical protein